MAASATSSPHLSTAVSSVSRCVTHAKYAQLFYKTQSPAIHNVGYCLKVLSESRSQSRSSNVFTLQKRARMHAHRCCGELPQSGAFLSRRQLPPVCRTSPPIGESVASQSTPFIHVSVCFPPDHQFARKHRSSKAQWQSYRLPNHLNAVLVFDPCLVTKHSQRYELGVLVAARRALLLKRHLR